MSKRGKRLLEHSKLPIVTADGLAEAAERVVAVLGNRTDMAVLIHKKTRVITQGISGKSGKFHTEHCMLYGSHFVGGVTPGKGGQEILGLPVFDTVYEAKQATRCDATMIFVPAPFAAEAILEAEDAGVELIVCITEGIPIRDMIEVSRVMRASHEAA